MEIPAVIAGCRTEVAASVSGRFFLVADGEAQQLLDGRDAELPLPVYERERALDQRVQRRRSRDARPQFLAQSRDGDDGDAEAGSDRALDRLGASELHDYVEIVELETGPARVTEEHLISVVYGGSRENRLAFAGHLRIVVARPRLRPRYAEEEFRW